MQSLKPKILATAAGLLSLSLAGSVSAQDVHVAPSHERAAHGALSFAPEHGAILHEHASSQHFDSVHEPGFHAEVGGHLPGSVSLHPLPDRFVTQVPGAHAYQYGIVNDRRVIVEPRSRRIMHVYD
ncbi:DUF1236 domain-containing protein [Bradyrhizobium sp.]|jgi:hypothetical protein|uniref:DUF1236 domain-containing protein n=1 Tax=Bradyrhizobium sp. TaxID=376 RepID=UPI00391DB22F